MGKCWVMVMAVKGASTVVAGLIDSYKILQCIFLIYLIAFSTVLLASSDDGETLGFMLTWFGIANYEGENDCPDGLAVAPDRDTYLASKGEKERAELTDPKNQGKFYHDMVMRGPDGINVCDHPETVVEPALRTVEGRAAYGLNLTGTDNSNSPTPNTCAHKKFSTGLNGENAVDNQYYRITGCQFGLRNNYPGGYITKYRNGVMLDGNFTILIEITGVDDRENDDDISIGIYQGQDPVVRGADGVGVLSDTSLRVIDNPRYHSVMEGKIENGVILSTEPKSVYLIEKTGESATASPHLHFRAARIRLEVDDEGNFDGVLAGYHDWLPLYRSISKGLSFGEIYTGFTCPAVYDAYKRLADGYPDPDTGECTAVSIAYLMKGVSAYVIHPHKQTTKVTIQ